MGTSDSRRVEKTSARSSSCSTAFNTEEALSATLVRVKDFDCKADNTVDCVSTQAILENEVYRSFGDEDCGVLKYLCMIKNFVPDPFSPNDKLCLHL